ncbi:alpha/beta hydrolase [Vibrio breoganii]|uniref:esterase/lipase family protein n=1 Tax=Vibrio breoganii TaxID=553239 RepID=UPI000C82B1C8|nr:alpha/beta hydrolase [Vibrio breoganii]
MVKYLHLSFFLLLTTVLVGCSSSRFFDQQSSELAIKKESGVFFLLNLTGLTTEEMQAYCLSFPKNTDITLVSLLHCNNELLRREDLNPSLRDDIIATYNEALFSLIVTDQQQNDTTKRVILNYADPVSFTLSEQMLALDTRIKPEFFGELGIPIVINRDYDNKGQEIYYPLEGIFQDATIVVDQVKQHGATFEISLSIHVNDETASINLGANEYQLKHSPGSAYLALLEEANIDDFNWMGFVSPSQAEKRRGVFSIGEISKQKIPLIMIHGLNSDPLIWRHLTMALLNEPELMSRYQIWHIYYPSGPPPFYTARRTRDDLRSMLQEIDNPQLSDNAVIIGHSMGGIIAKLLATKSNLRLWDATFNIPPAELLPHDNDTIKNIFIFDPVFKKSTVFFLDTPFKGSEVANSAVGYIGDFLVSLPSEFTDSFKNLIERVGPDVITKKMQPFLLDNGPNSVEVLRPGHPLMDTLYDIPLAGDSYAIIGSNGKLKCEDPIACSSISDGVVSYDSANYSGAKERVIVPSSHNSFQSEEAIDFILSKLKFEVH